MGIRKLAPLLIAGVLVSACSEEQQTESVTGPLSAARPTDPSACDPNSLNSLITGYFPGNTSTPIKSLKDAMIAATTGAAKRDEGFEILDSIGSLSRNQSYTVDPADGSALAQGVIKCMFDAGQFSPDFPTDPIYDFAPALTPATGGAFYVRGGTSGGVDTVVGALITPLGGGQDITVLSGVAPPPPAELGAPQLTWAQILADSNPGSEGRVLLYGYPVSEPADPLEYEWATIPPAAVFSPGAIVAVCDDNTALDAMVHESNVGMLQYSSGNPICGSSISVVLKETGWGPRALAARLARVLVSSLTPSTLQAAVVVGFKGGSGGTVTTVKSTFKTEQVDTITLEFLTALPKTIYISKMPYPVRVRATAVVDGEETGVNGTCVYLTGANNNGNFLELSGNHECDDEPPGSASVITKSIKIGNDVVAGYADFGLTVSKTGGLTVTATSTDADGTTGVVDRDGQVFIEDFVRTNVKP